MEPIKIQKNLTKEPNKYLHSKEHVLADDLMRALHEPKRFTSYLGIAMRYHESDLRALLQRVLEKHDLPTDARGKYFFASLVGLVKKPVIKKTTPAKKKSVHKSSKRKNGKHTQYSSEPKKHTPRKSRKRTSE